MKKNKWHGSATGADFEEQIIRQLSAEGFEPRKEQTLTNGRIRRKDMKADITVNTGHKIECKTTTENTNLTFAVYENGKNVNIKYHQIVNADYFVIRFRPHPTYVVSKRNFLKWWANLERKKMSIMWKDLKEIGFELRNFDFLREV